MARVVAAQDRLVVASGIGGHVQWSTDGGRTWQNASRGLGDKRVTALALAGSTAYAGTASGVFSGDGLRWHPLGPAKTPVRSLAVAGETIYAGSVGTNARGLYRSVDAGATWQRVLDKDVEGVAIDSAAPSSVYVVTADGFLASADGGATWHARNAGLPRLRMRLTFRTGAVSYVVGTG